VVDWTGTLVEFRHSYDDFHRFISYGGRMELRLARLFGSSDQSHLANNFGGKKEWPVYLNLGNIDLTIRSKPPNRTNIFVALVPVPPKYQFKGNGKTTAVKEQQIHNREALRNVFERIFRPLDSLFNTGKLMLCADG
jgi:hypothetical protein